MKTSPTSQSTDFRLPAACACLLLAGCGLFSGPLGGPDGQETAGLSLPPIAPSRETVQVEVFLTERPVGDPLLGDILWDNVDESGALEPSVRSVVNANGFRVGIVGSDPPQALQALLGLTLAKDQPSLQGRRIGLFTGSTTEIGTSQQFDRISLDLKLRDDSVQTIDHEQARCVLRLTARQQQPGWARLELLPELHHGDQRLRPVPDADGWRMRTSQAVDKLFALAFELTLNQGEMVVVGYNEAGPGSAGHHFFVGDEQSGRLQRLVIVRLADIQTAVGETSE